MPRAPVWLLAMALSCEASPRDPAAAEVTQKQAEWNASDDKLAESLRKLEAARKPAPAPVVAAAMPAALSGAPSSDELLPGRLRVSLHAPDFASAVSTLTARLGKPPDSFEHDKLWRVWTRDEKCCVVSLRERDGKLDQVGLECNAWSREACR